MSHSQSVKIRSGGDGTYVLDTRCELPGTIDDVFAFFADARNLGRLTPPWLHFSITTPGEIDMKSGTLIAYRLKIHGVRIHWLTEITTWDPPHHFVDEQRRGPYGLWRHEHHFRAVGPSLTEVVDEVRYRPPGGRFANEVLVAPDLRRIFTFRQQELRKVFG